MVWKSFSVVGGAVLLTAWASPAAAKPIAPGIFCETYPDAVSCLSSTPECTLCHSETQAPPAMNAFGDAVKSALGGYVSSPVPDAPFTEFLPTALGEVEDADADGDGFSNLDELLAGSRPGNADSIPLAPSCPTEAELEELDYLVCQYDPAFAYRKVGLDFCGIAPSYEEVTAFLAMSGDDRMQTMHALLDACLDSPFYRGPNGVLWQLAHRKVRPVGGLAAFADFADDYNYFTYTQIDGHDVRDLLVGQYLVMRTDTGTPENIVSEYTVVESLPTQPLQPDRRAGLLTMAWPLFYNTMFTALPRGTAASAYRAFLGLDIAASEGLSFPVDGEPVDYDGAGVDAPDCATCHSTLDPLSYPFATYNGLQADDQIGVFEYDPDRIEKYFVSIYPAMADMPESGVIFGQPVADLLEWAQVAANSDAFYAATTNDYWNAFMGDKASPEDGETYEEFTLLWQSLRDDEQHSVEAMLHRFIETEAYGAP